MVSKICPITKQRCHKKCAWYVEHQKICAVVLISDDIRDITENIEEMRNDYDN